MYCPKDCLAETMRRQGKPNVNEYLKEEVPVDDRQTGLNVLWHCDGYMCQPDPLLPTLDASAVIEKNTSYAEAEIVS